MKLYITGSVNLFLISLNIMTYNVDAFNKSDLSIICAARWGTEITPTPPPQCTAIALTYFHSDKLTDLNSTKGALPLMVVDDRLYTWEWGEMVAEDHISDYVKELVELGVDVIALDLMNYRKRIHPYDDNEFTANLIKFIQGIKRERPNILIGIAMRLHSDPTIHSVDVKAINSHVDFYLLKFIYYRSCKPGKVYAATLDDIMNTIKLFRDCGMDSSKLIYTIDLRIISFKDLPVLGEGLIEYMAFSQLCSKEVSKYRKFCFNSIPDLFDKAQLRRKENLLGIYVDNTDYDDFDGSCLCAGTDGQPIKFKGMTVIAGADSDDQAKVEPFLCSTAYPIIKHP